MVDAVIVVVIITAINIITIIIGLERKGSREAAVSL